MIAATILLAAGVLGVLGVDLWPLSVGISQGKPAHIALAMLACLLLAEETYKASGVSRALLATACMLLPLIPTTSPYSMLHCGVWIIIVSCGFLAWLCQGRAKAWLVAGMAWMVWYADSIEGGSVGGSAQAVIIVGLAFGVLVLNRPVRHY